jgi:hypothetical protein
MTSERLRHSTKMSRGSCKIASATSTPTPPPCDTARRPAPPQRPGAAWRPPPPPSHDVGGRRRGWLAAQVSSVLPDGLMASFSTSTSLPPPLAAPPPPTRARRRPTHLLHLPVVQAPAASSSVDRRSARPSTNPAMQRGTAERAEQTRQGGRWDHARGRPRMASGLRSGKIASGRRGIPSGID